LHLFLQINVAFINAGLLVAMHQQIGVRSRSKIVKIAAVAHFAQMDQVRVLDHHHHLVPLHRQEHALLEDHISGTAAAWVVMQAHCSPGILQSIKLQRHMRQLILPIMGELFMVRKCG
jgi:hypothetical protein